MRTSRPLLAAALLVLLPLQGTGAQGLKTLDEVNACIQANIPQSTSVQTVEFVSRDKVGYERTTRAKIYEKRGDDGMRRVLTLFTRPLDLRGAQYLMHQKADRPADMFVYTPELKRTKRITGHGASGSLFGTDFSYEDFERLHHLNRPGSSELLEGQVVMERPTYVIETKPESAAESAYESVVTFWDQKTCVALKTESYERGQRLRKRLKVDPEQIVSSGGIWVARDLLMEDVRDGTQTRLVVESVEVGVTIKDRTFSVTQLGKNLR